jgi:hypothetical protein
MFYGVGQISGMHDPSVLEKGFLSNAHIAQTFGHAVVGCVSASIAGGSCGAGAASAGFAAAAGPLLPGADISPERFVSRVIVGGIASRLAGGSFANGATSAAFAYLFNELGSCVDRGYCSKDTFGSPTRSGEVRGADPAGCGGYDCPRGTRPHLAIDYVAEPGEAVLSPIDGKVVRTAFPGKPGLSGLVIEGSTYTAKVFYISPDESLLGKFVMVGQQIGVAQEIRQAYGAPNMINHVHLEMYRSNVRVNPLSLFGRKSPTGK